MVNFLDRLGGSGGVAVVNWLTPIWILCIGVLLGLLGCLLIWGVTFALSRIPGVATLADDFARKWIGIGIASVLFFALGIATLPVDLGLQKPEAVALLVWAACSFLMGFALIHLVYRRAADSMIEAVHEGPLWPLFLACCGAAVFAFVGLFVARTPGSLLETLVRWPQVTFAGTDTREHTIAAPPADFEDPPVEEIPVQFRRSEIARITLQSNQRLRVALRPYNATTPPEAILIVPAEEQAMWEKPKDGSSPFPEPEVNKLYVRNFGDGPAKLTVSTTVTHAYPEMTMSAVIAGAVMLIFLAYVVVRSAFPKMSAVTLATVKSETSQNLFQILLYSGMLLLTLFIIIPYNTFGEDIKVLQDTGLQCVLLLALIHGVWSASSSVADEIEGKTALTLLSKPVSRRDFILGKFLGITWSTLLLCTALGVVLIIGVAYKPIYDQREGAELEATWQLCFDEATRTLPGIVLAFFAATVLISLAVAFSTRLPTLPNLIICFSIFILGNLMPAVVQSQVIAKQFEPVVVIGRVIATVFPMFEHFNISTAISAGQNVPPLYVATAFLYCIVYCTIAMLLGLTLFEDRDLA